MKSVLIAKDVTQTTRFNFEDKVRGVTLSNLLKIFSRDGYEINRVNASKIHFKLINRNKMKSIEITSSYISFFPCLEEEEKNDMKKIIYNIIAKRSSVYLTSSEHNLNAAKLSLIKGEIRSVASMLYYSLHKFLSGRYYNLLNSKFEISDLEIQITELEHFTSQIFYKSTDRFEDISEELSMSNYIEKLKNSSKTINPFLFILYDLKDINQLTLDLTPLIKFLSQEVLLINLEDDYDSTIKKIDTYIDASKKRKTGEKKQERQEREVNASIAYALKKLIEKPSDSNIWAIFIVCLRLYWLRQNADYDYDFEVKTSTREMALLLSYIEKYQKETSDFYREGKLNKVKAQSEYSEKDMILKKIDGDERDLIEIEDTENFIDTTESLFVDFSFPTEIKEENKVHIYMTALHVDIEFSHVEIINMMNLMNRISNKVKYFSFTTSPGEFQLNIHVNKEGRWTFWFDNNKRNQALLTEYDLSFYFKEFINELISVYENYGSEFVAEFLISEPIILNRTEKSLIDLHNINDANKTIAYRKIYLKGLLEKRIKKMLDIPRFNDIKIGNVQISINLEFQTSENVFSVVPLKNLGKSFVNIEKEADGNFNVLLNFVILSEDFMDIVTYAEKSRYSRNFENLVNKLIKKLEIRDIYHNHIIAIEETEYYDFVNRIGISDDLQEGMKIFFNEVCYKLIDEEEYTDALAVLMTIERKITYNSYLYATRGMLHLRSNEMENEVALKEGEKFYQLAIRNFSDDREEYEKSDFEKKFYIELARFYIHREKNQEKAEEYLNKASAIESVNFLEDEVRRIKSELEML